jgi:hypothetical protein
MLKIIGTAAVAKFSVVRPIEPERKNASFVNVFAGWSGTKARGTMSDLEHPKICPRKAQRSAKSLARNQCTRHVQMVRKTLRIWDQIRDRIAIKVAREGF